MSRDKARNLEMNTQIFVSIIIKTRFHFSTFHLQNVLFYKGGQSLDFCVADAIVDLMEIPGKAESRTLKTGLFGVGFGFLLLVGWFGVFVCTIVGMIVTRTSCILPPCPLVCLCGPVCICCHKGEMSFCSKGRSGWWVWATCHVPAPQLLLLMEPAHPACAVH